MKKIILPLLTIYFLTACSSPADKANGKSDSPQAQQDTGNKTGGDSPTGQPPAKTAGTFTLTTKEGVQNPGTMENYTDIYVQHSTWSSPKKIVSENAFSEIASSDYTTKKIPAGAAFAFSCWYAGGGHDYYGAEENGKLNIYSREEGEEIAPNSLPFTLFTTLEMK